MPIKGLSVRPKDTITKLDVKYRELSSLNCSMIKLFDSDPVRFYEQFKLGKKRKDSKSTSLIIGDLVDFYLLECGGNEDEFNNKFDEKFSLYEGVKGTGQVFLLADELFEVTQQYVGDDGEVSESFENRFKEAFARIQSKGKYKGRSEEKALEDFNDNGYDYFKSLIDNVGKTVVDVSLLDKVKKIVDVLRTDSFTKDMFADDDEDIEYLPKFPIVWKYSTTGGKEIECKSELDLLRIDHRNKKIYLCDLKTTYDNENFEYSYIKHQYYLQGAFYYLAVSYWAKENSMEDYDIVPMEFIVGDTSSNNRRPIRYQTTNDDLSHALNGFCIKSGCYRGIKELIEEIDWCEKNNIWNASRNLIESEGILKLNLKYE